VHSAPCNAALLRLVWTVRVTVVSAFSLDWAGAVANNFVITVVLHAPGFLPWFVPYPAFVLHSPFSFLLSATFIRNGPCSALEFIKGRKRSCAYALVLCRGAIFRSGQGDKAKVHGFPRSGKL
jgi:hypothetical protein